MQKNYKIPKVKKTIKIIKRQVKGHLKCESQLMYTTNILFVLMSWIGKMWKSYPWSIPLAHINFLSTKETSLLLNSVYGGVDCPYLRGRYLFHYWQLVLIFILDIHASLKTTALSYISASKLFFSSDLKVKDGGRTASFQH